MTDTLVPDGAGAGDLPEEPEPDGPIIGTPSQASRWKIDIPGVRQADVRAVKWQLYLSLVGLFLGLAMGALQASDRGDFALEELFNRSIDLYDAVGLQSYYQGLTIHGVTLALVFTFTFSNAFLSLTVMKSLKRPLASAVLRDVSLYLAWIGVALAAWAMLANKATVLFTFYPPLQATPAFYIGAVFLVISTWCTLANQLLTLRAWRRDGHEGERIPLLAFTSIVTEIMWFLASIGIAIEVLVFVLPWSLGLTDTIDPQFTRVLFWFTGHPIVYFWLLPIYVSWYLFLPQQAGKGRLASDGLVRLVFLAFLMLLPVGIHHQFTDPGIPFSSKTVSWVLTFCIFFPSVATFFSVIASLENAGRNRGGKGIVGWIPKLRWSDPSVSAQLLAGIGFILGGVSGLINASYTVNLTVHNTAFIVGHFHLTVGTAVALSIMGICYWMVPYLTGKKLWGRRLAVLQTWLWIGGVFVFSRGQMQGGIEGMPRRTNISNATYIDRFTPPVDSLSNFLKNWDIADGLTAIGGTIMFLSGVCFFVVMLGTIYSKRQVADVQRMPIADEPYHPVTQSWPILDRLGLWSAVAGILSLIVYGEIFFHYLPLEMVPGGFQLW
ncbi:MAG: cbb3-type cytochrome c oxidase subunit I [Acidimicrobiales bacterium]|nr:cbb3-type cytochrome c oxidase subunit I [Acidimicrobiales bacterium]